MSDLPLPPLDVQPKSGAEPFHESGERLGFDVLRFWCWSASDLASNALRGVLAEFLVAEALGVAGGVRAEWDAYDLRTPEGITVEVKSCAYLQTWAQHRHSTISFGIAPSRAWNYATAEWEGDVRRQARVYVFALLAHRNKATLDPTDVSQWEFYVVPTAVLDAELPAQARLGLAALLRLGPERCGFAGLRDAVRRAAEGSPHPARGE